jgi:DNA-binding CsgD family transcriptional regulator
MVIITQEDTSALDDPEPVEPVTTPTAPVAPSSTTPTGPVIPYSGRGYPVTCCGRLADQVRRNRPEIGRVTIAWVDQLLEREGELAALRAAVGSAGEGRGSVVLLTGEAGIGKTSILRAMYAEMGPEGFVVGRCEPLSVPVPLAPLRELADAAGAPDLPELDGDDRFALARALLAQLTARRVAVAVVEDAHWADPATLDVVRILARRAEQQPLVLVVTYRDDELSAAGPLAVLVGDLATESSVQRLGLRPLSAAGVRTLAADRVDVTQLLRVTGGNPFLVVESLAADGALPSSVRDMALARVARLGPSARGVVDAAAVIGQRVAPDLLDAVAPESAGAVEEALACGVLTDDGATLGFRHELTRQAIEGAIASPRRARLHAMVVAALDGSTDHALLAHHAERAGLHATASQHAVLAADAAERVGALLETGLQLERALRLGDELNSQERADLLLRYARAMNFAGRQLEEARDAALEAVTIADGLVDRRRGGRARSILSATLWSLDELTKARAAALEAVTLLAGEPPDEEVAHAHAAHLRIESIAFDPSAVIEAAPAALAVAAEAGAHEALIDIGISLGLARGHRGEPDAAALLGAARAEATSVGATIPAIRAYVNGLAVAADARDHERADAILADALELFARFQTTIPRLYALVMHARSRFDRGDWDGALTALAEGRAVWHGGHTVADGVEGLIRARRGEAGAASLVRGALTSLTELPPGWRHLFLHAALAEIAWIEGDLNAARSAAESGLSAPYATQLARPAGDAALWLARAGGAVPATDAPLPDPVRHELAGDWNGAINAWRSLDAPYEAALAALPGDDRAARHAMMVLRRLGADGTARAFALERQARGGVSLRGPRRSTLTNPAGLTRREQEVLRALAAGGTNAQLAAQLHLSERTVAHHVSAILTKLGAPTRTAAVEAARGQGLLEDGPP